MIFSACLSLLRVLISVIFFSGLCLVILPDADAHAWFARESSRTEKTKVLKKMQRKNIAARTVGKLLESDFFASRELPERAVLARLELIGDGLGTTEEQFTNLVLNRLLDHPKIMVANQDLITDLSMEYALMDYLPDLEARKQGVLLGVDYYVGGFLRSEDRVTEGGRVKRHYECVLSLKNLRTNEEIVSVEYHTNRNKRSRH